MMQLALCFLHEMKTQHPDVVVFQWATQSKGGKAPGEVLSQLIQTFPVCMAEVARADWLTDELRDLKGFSKLGLLQLAEAIIPISRELRAWILEVAEYDDSPDASLLAMRASQNWGIDLRRMDNWQRFSPEIQRRFMKAYWCNVLALRPYEFPEEFAGNEELITEVVSQSLNSPYAGNVFLAANRCPDSEFADMVRNILIQNSLASAGLQ